MILPNRFSKRIQLNNSLIKIAPFILVTAITIFYFLFAGYKFAVSDEGGWIVYLNRRLDPSLYASDYLWSGRQSAPHEQLSIFADIDYFAASLLSFNFPLTHFLLLFITKYLLFLVAYFAALTIFKNKQAAILTTFAVIPSYFFLGPLVGSNENVFIPRVLTQPILLTFIFLVIFNRWFVAALLAGFATSVHAVSALPVLPLIIITYLNNLKNLKSKILLGVIFGLLIGAMPLVLKIVTSPPTASLLNIGPISSYLKAVVMSRKGYLLLSHWNTQQWTDSLFVFALAIPFFLYANNKNFGNFKRNILFLYLAILASNFIYFLATSVIGLGTFLPLQFPRSIVFVYWVNLILVCGMTIYFLNNRQLFSYLVGILLIASLFLGKREAFYLLTTLFVALPCYEQPLKKIRPLSYLGKPAVIFLVGIVAFASYTYYQIKTDYSAEKIYGVKSNKLLWREFIFNRVHFAFPKGNIGAQLQLWVRDHTEKGAVLLIDPDLGFFRVYSQRAVVFDHKDLGYVYYSDEAAKKIQEREADVADFENITEDKIIQLQSKYNFNYLVWKENRGKLSFPVVYKQFGFVIYKLK